MMPISFSAPVPNADERYKVKIATEQLKKLLDRVKVNTLYRTLSPSDRSLLTKEGNVQVLVDNLVFITQRIGLHDKIVVGFNDLAFDKSLYASEAVRTGFFSMNKNCCAYCEKYFDDEQDAVVAHVKPVALCPDTEFFANGQYADQVYDYENLILLCNRCAHLNRKYLYKNVSKYSVDDSGVTDNLLINPYHDNPRDYIRFNPLNGLAYAWDAYIDFSQSQFGKAIDPELMDLGVIPTPLYPGYDFNNNVNQLDDIDYLRWALDKNLNSYRGYRTINALDLNRPSLVVARLIYGNHLWSLMGSYGADQNTSYENSDEALLEHYQSKLGVIHQFRSITIDLINLVQGSDAHKSSLNLNPISSSAGSEDSTSTVINPEVGEKSSTAFPIKIPYFVHSYQFEIPFWLQSLLVYMVIETELDVKGKRRIVSLTASDYLYGAQGDHKCVFLAIDWSEDINNVIKVRDDKHVWETSFKELALSSTLEILQLFSGNEVWAEGNYLPLLKSQ